MITCDIDQFYCVESIAFDTYRTKFKLLNNHYIFRKNNPSAYLLKELFNMVGLQVINILFIIVKKIPENNNSCNWKNLINLKTIYNMKLF